MHFMILIRADDHRMSILNIFVINPYNRIFHVLNAKDLLKIML